MKMKTILQSCATLVVGLALLLPGAVHAGGNGSVMSKFQPIKSSQNMDQLKPGDTIVKDCRACGAVTMVRVEKRGKGVYDYIAKKCEQCGSEDASLAVSKQPVLFKDQRKP